MKTINEITDALGGKKVALAKAANVTKQAVSQWKRIPVARVLIIEAALNHKVSRHEMRPDIYPKDSFCNCPSCVRERSQQGGSS